MVIIAVENSLAQHLHVNSQIVDRTDLQGDPNAWSVRVAGEFMIMMNNMMALPVIVRHPQRFNDPRSFVMAFKREFLQLLEVSPIPHAKVRLIRDAQFTKVVFTRQIAPATQQLLQAYQNNLLGPNATIDWEQNPSNTDIALQLAEQMTVTNPLKDDNYVAMDIFEDYSMTDFKITAHPQFNEHNRRYLYRSSSINDIMNATAVSQQILDDYEKYLEQRNKSEQIIERDLDCAADYLGYCEALGVTILDDVTLIYHYFSNYEKLHDERVTVTYFKKMGYAFREFARFLRVQSLFNAEDFDKFIQAVSQGIEDFNSKQRVYHLQRIFHDLQQQVQAQREHAFQYINRRYSVDVKLQDYEPMMWRRFIVNGATRLDRLCFEVLAAFNADGNHLFELQAGKTHYQLPLFESGLEPVVDMTKIWLGDIKAPANFTLTYDFGDMWRFSISLKETNQGSFATLSGPLLVDGYGKGIIDDIGGVGGLKQAAEDDGRINRQLDFERFNQQWPQKIEKLRNGYE